MARRDLEGNRVLKVLLANKVYKVRLAKRVYVENKVKLVLPVLKVREAQLEPMASRVLLEEMV
jgi:hypothetical protein